MKDCLFCKSNKDLLIKKYKYWTVLIHPHNRSYLGKCMVKLNRHTVDFFDTTTKEREELFRIIRKLRKVINDFFKPDLFNYAFLGNEIRHLHLHFIPRYKKKRRFKNIEFVDKRWNHNYSPYNKRKLPGLVLDELKGQIRKRLK